MKVAKIKVEKNIKKAISQAVDQIGGFKKIIKKGDVVLLKPNFNTADPFPASTDIAFLKAVVELVYQHSPKSVILGDSSTLSLNTRKIMEKIGVFELEKMEKAPKIYVFDERPWTRKEVPKGKYLKRVYIPQYIDRADKLILLPCLKTHGLAQFTGALKLSIGFMKPFHRVALHAWRIQEKIAEMNKIISPDLVIMDARKCFINKGPSKGEVAQPNLILASKSRLNIDIEGVKIIQSFRGNSLKGLDPLEITQIKKAKQFGIK
jgi:uncharacterized protein (DUF362 family)